MDKKIEYQNGEQHIIRGVVFTILFIGHLYLFMSINNVHTGNLILWETIAQVFILLVLLFSSILEIYSGVSHIKGKSCLHISNQEITLKPVLGSKTVILTKDIQGVYSRKKLFRKRIEVVTELKTYTLFDEYEVGLFSIKKIIEKVVDENEV